jgi:phosphopantetheinyl transferase
MTGPHDVSVVLLDLDSIDPGDDPAALPAEDLALAAHITDAMRRRRFIAAHRKVRLLLAQIIGLTPAEVPIRRGRNGKPQVEGGLVHFSVSTRDAACAVATSLTHPVGVKIARVPRETPVPVLKEILPPLARSAILAAEPEEQPREFTMWWCRVEAAVRACGAGLDEAETCLETAQQQVRGVGLDLVAAVAIAHRSTPLDAVRWQVNQPVEVAR